MLFGLKAWAEPFVPMRAALHKDEWCEELKDRFNSGLSSDLSFVSPNGARNQRIISPTQYDSMAA